MCYSGRTNAHIPIYTHILQGYTFSEGESAERDTHTSAYALWVSQTEVTVQFWHISEHGKLKNMVM